MKVLQTLARHSDPKLTLNVYSHLTLFDTAPALDVLPDSSPGSKPASEPSTLAATGTDGQHISERFAHYLPTGGDGTGRNVADSDVMPKVNPQIAMDPNPLEDTGFDA